jgi:hypothetical protein
MENSKVDDGIIFRRSEIKERKWTYLKNLSILNKWDNFYVLKS